MIRLATKALVAIVAVTGAHYHVAGPTRDAAATEERELTPEEKDAREFVERMQAKAEQPTLVFIHVDGAVAGGLDMPCNPMWSDDCAIPVENLRRVLLDVGALPVGGIGCSGALAEHPQRVELDDLEACLPGFELLPALTGKHLFLTTPP